MAGWTDYLAAGASGGSGSGGYGGGGNASSQAIDVRTTIDAGKFGGSSFDFSNNAFGAKPNWWLIAGCALLAYLVFRK